MAEGGSGRCDRLAPGRAGQRRRALVVKPVSWPRYMIEKRLRSGAVAYYWNPRVLDVRAGFTLGRGALGQSFSSACERAAMLNAHLDAFRQGRGMEKNVDLQ